MEFMAGGWLTPIFAVQEAVPDPILFALCPLSYEPPPFPAWCPETLAFVPNLVDYLRRRTPLSDRCFRSHRAFEKFGGLAPPQFFVPMVDRHPPSPTVFFVSVKLCFKPPN